MKLSRKSGNLFLALFFVFTALVPYSHCSADEIALHYGASCGPDCAAKHGFSARHAHGPELHEHTPDHADYEHFHFILEGVNLASRFQFAQDGVKAADNSATVEAFSSPENCFIESRALDSPIVAFHPRLQAIPTGLSPPYRQIAS